MTRTFKVLLVLFGVALAPVTPAGAQVCGDADGSGSVGVSDGVQTLRAAAGLESVCTPAVCDVDGSGAVTVTDGVNVLRKAAGLPISDACTGAAGQPATLLGEIRPLLTLGLPFATGKPVTACTNAPDGELEEVTDAEGTTTTFFGCQVGNVVLGGDVLVSTGILGFSVFEALTVGDEDFIADYDGDLTMTAAGGGQSLSGLLEVSTESSGFSDMTLDAVLVVAGQLGGGSATIDLDGSDIADAFTSVRLTFDGSGVADVLATQGNNSTQSFHFDLATGAVTPQ